MNLINIPEPELFNIFMPCFLRKYIRKDTKLKENNEFLALIPEAHEKIYLELNYKYTNKEIKKNVKSRVLPSNVWRLYLIMIERMTLASTYVLHSNLLSLCWSLTSE